MVLIGGSGPSDRHNDGFFDALRTHLAGAGVAVLAYDKRGAGKSTGAWATATVGDLAHDAAAAVAALQAHPRVAAGAVGVLGHSEGGWVALRLCARPRDDLTRLTTPTLAIFGENDPLVPVRASVERYQETAARTARYQQTVVFPGAGHRLQVTAGFAPGYLTRLSTWCQDQATSSRPG